MSLGEFVTIVTGTCEVSEYGMQPKFQVPLLKPQTVHIHLLEV